MKKKLISIVGLLLIAMLALAGCGSATGGDTRTVKIGINGDDADLWRLIQQKVEKDHIKLKIISFSDYVQPNEALNDGSLDLNAFQTITYMNQFKKDHNLKISAIGSTVIAPMGIYSHKYKDVKDIPKGSTITIPNDVTNAGRALKLLQSAKLIKLKDDFDPKGSIEQITENPKNLTIKPVAAGQTARSLDDVSAAIINNGFAVQAGLNPGKDALYKEDPSKKSAMPYINVIAAQTKHKNDKDFQKIVKAYQSKEVKEYINKRDKGATVPVIVSIEKIKDL
ncbi:MetQ/NlpA family ABC transporter substrate-binding protein [Priestia koreensis]|uniref:MetQ/NlpA family ABC transporter substrate-binding protein n=1 Tax=Priestia koreensis TaxID=284581 RepID=UPI001F5AB3DE|nr:MetQ/NlpA family ABC transporter substrate-binding protein [Priestia koreensis]MCM3004492.1 MetQ/NlpA family ABC transporter substrate-binding protein [Priestia koreensis]UNL84706.1 MetQ/NlpA family ABC transporter substrate-binding protein [Priestia koreensis]